MKKCPECDQDNYSASKAGFWICYYCGNKINDLTVEVAKGDDDNAE